MPEGEDWVRETTTADVAAEALVVMMPDGNWFVRVTTAEEESWQPVTLGRAIFIYEEARKRRLKADIEKLL